jgi:hypothetical protein
MSFTGSFICTGFKMDLLAGRVNLGVGGHSYRCSLYTNAAKLTADTLAYTTIGEHEATGTYEAGGKPLVIAPGGSSGTTAWIDFEDLTWPESTITARGALIWNSSVTSPIPNPAVAVLDFGFDRRSFEEDFTLVFPSADALYAIIRIV